MRCYTLVFLLLPLLLAADAPKKEPAKPDSDRILGTWKVISAEREGQVDPVSKHALTTFAKDGKLSVKFADGKTGAGTYKLDPNQKPKAIEYTLDYGPNKGKAQLGIYTLEGDSLKICRADAGKERPKEFVTKGKPGLMLFVMERQKPATASAPPPAAPIFPDKALEAAVRADLHEPTGELTEAKLASLSVLVALDKKIQNLKGLEKCPNVSQINLAKNQVVDLTPLKDLPILQWLDLSDNKITDVAPLQGLTKLQYLNLADNQIAKIDALGGLSSLSSLELAGNKITDITAVGKLTKLASLYAAKNQIKDISALSKVTQLTTLNLEENQIQDLTPLAKQTQLGSLVLRKNKITDLAPLVQWAKTDSEGAKRIAPYLRLYLAGNPLSDAAKSKQLPELKKYVVHVND